MMSHSKENLVLHLKLDEIIEEGDERKVSDALTGSKYNVKGDTLVVTDENFGSCLSFDGTDDYVEVPDSSHLQISGDITIEAWVYISKAVNDWVRIVGKGDLTKRNYGLWYNINTNQWLFQQYASANTGPTAGLVNQSDNQSIDVNKWYHLTGVLDQKNHQAYLYLDGKEIASQSGLTGTPITSSDSLTIGYAGYNSAHTGKIAHVRIYNRALFPEEIKQDMDDDLSAIASFNKTHPLDFNLYEGEDKEPVIFIENGTKGQELTLEIVNNSDRPITLPTKSGEVSATNHHFELRFRPDTLSQDSLKQLDWAEKEVWSMSSPVTQADSKVSLYFLATNNQVGAKETIPLTLQHINGAAAGGARTTRVELKCPQFTDQGETVTDYYREKRLSIVNHRGKKHIPLHVGFVGSNRILNDGSSPNQLILRITNVLKDKSIPFNPASKGDEASKFIISFDVDTDWALGTKSQVGKIAIAGKDWRPNQNPEEDWNIDPDNEGETPIWTITHQNEEEAGLAPGQVVQLTISNIISSLPSGHANLYVRYENIPGYWDGTFVCTIEKSPILYKEGNVGIGTTTPQAKLSINGDLHVGGDSDPGDNNLLVDGTTTTNLLSVTGSLSFGSDTRQMINLWDNKFGIGIQSGTQYFRTAGNFAWYLGGNHDDGLLEAGGGSVQMVINGSGNVGIGNPSPDHKLVVGPATGGRHLVVNDIPTARWGFQTGGFSLAIQNDFNNDWQTRMLLTKDGNVGIGTTNPSQKLVVSSTHNTGKQAESGMAYGGSLAIVSNAPQIDFISTQHKDWSINVSHDKMCFVREPWEYQDLVLDGNGNVGIGTDDPDEKLHIQGTGTVRGFVKTSGNFAFWRAENSSRAYGVGAYFSKFSIYDYNAAANRLVIDSSGNVGIGTYNPTAKLEVYGDLKLRRSNNQFRMYLAPDGKNLIFEIQNSIHGTNKKMRWDGDTNWDSVSDLSLKTDIENEGNILSRLMQLDVKNYRWKDNPEANIKKIGFVAQDVQPLFPAIVGEFKDQDADESTLTLKYAKFSVF
ncbi:MAG: hypothetical protein F6K55_17130 [Moorea sp. SIO4A3]|nr:hypothetical protein [Moorena sp. SIO4A3]